MIVDSLPNSIWGEDNEVFPERSQFPNKFIILDAFNGKEGTALPPVEGVFYDGQVFEVYSFTAGKVSSSWQVPCVP